MRTRPVAAPPRPRLPMHRRPAVRRRRRSRRMPITQRCLRRAQRATRTPPMPRPPRPCMRITHPPRRRRATRMRSTPTAHGRAEIHTRRIAWRHRRRRVPATRPRDTRHPPSPRATPCMPIPMRCTVGQRPPPRRPMHMPRMRSRRAPRRPSGSEAHRRQRRRRSPPARTRGTRRPSCPRTTSRMPFRMPCSARLPPRHQGRMRMEDMRALRGTCHPMRRRPRTRRMRRRPTAMRIR